MFQVRDIYLQIHTVQMVLDFCGLGHKIKAIKHLRRSLLNFTYISLRDSKTLVEAIEAKGHDIPALDEKMSNGHKYIRYTIAFRD